MGRGVQARVSRGCTNEHGVHPCIPVTSHFDPQTNLHSGHLSSSAATKLDLKPNLHVSETVRFHLLNNAEDHHHQDVASYQIGAASRHSLNLNRIGGNGFSKRGRLLLDARNEWGVV